MFFLPDATPVRLVRAGVLALVFSALWAVPAFADEEKAHFHPADASTATPALVFEDHPGHQLALQDFKGKTVLLNLWATWCGPCVKEMPGLDALQAQYGAKAFEVVALSEDSRGQDAVDAFFKKHQLVHLKTYIDQSGRAPSALHAAGLPTTYLIGKDGKIIGDWQGSVDWMSPEVVGVIKDKLGGF